MLQVGLWFRGWLGVVFFRRWGMRIFSCGLLRVWWVFFEVRRVWFFWMNWFFFRWNPFWVKGFSLRWDQVIFYLHFWRLWGWRYERGGIVICQWRRRYFWVSVRVLNISGYDWCRRGFAGWDFISERRNGLLLNDLSALPIYLNFTQNSNTYPFIHNPYIPSFITLLLLPFYTLCHFLILRLFLLFNKKSLPFIFSFNIK